VPYAHLEGMYKSHRLLTSRVSHSMNASVVSILIESYKTSSIFIPRKGIKIEVASSPKSMRTQLPTNLDCI
jgi:hypothetical protein